MTQRKENFIVSARKYRPSAWSEVVGQEGITETLSNSIEQGQLAHAYLFCGPRGVGKTTCARIFAKEINRSEEHLDEDFSFNIFELDAASNNKVDDIRSLTDQVRIPPQIGRYKVYIIDEVHMLSQAAFNAFLKTLEEPPKHAIFILATTEKHKILPTILSRCQIYDFNRIRVDEIVSHLESIAQKEKIKSEPEALHVIAQKADGALRDALSIFDQLSSFTNRNLTYEAVLKNLHVLDYEYYFRLSNHLYKGEYSDSLLILDEVLKLGFDGSHFLGGLATHLRDLLVTQDHRTLALLEVGDNVKNQYLTQSKEIGAEWLLESLRLLPQFEYRLRGSANQRLLIEVALLSLAGISEQKKNADRLGTNEKPVTPLKPTVSKESKPATTIIDSKIESKSETAQPNVEATKDASAASIKPEVKAQEPAISENRNRARKTPVTISLNIDDEIEETELISSSENSNKDLLDQATGDEKSIKSPADVWPSLCEKFLSDGRSSLYSILVRQIPEDIDNTVTIKLHHGVEEEEFNLHKTEVLQSLRKAITNSNLQLKTEFSEIISETKLFSTKEKFESLAKKNPEIIKLKQDLDLDITF